MDKRYQVFVSSTYSDLKDERSKVIQTLMEQDCIPAGMELFPAADMDQFEFIKRIIDDCDYYILIVGARYGSMDEDGVSYTEKEYDYAVLQGIPVMAFLHNDISNIPIGKADMDSSLRAKLDSFRKKVEKGRLVQYWKNADELDAKVAKSLPKTIKLFPRNGWVRANLQTNAETLQEINQLRKENADLRQFKEKYIKEHIYIENIAEWDEKFEVHYLDAFSNSKRKKYISNTWQEWFRIIALEMERQESVFGRTDSFGLELELAIKNNYTKHEIVVDLDDRESVMYQLLGYGVIEKRANAVESYCTLTSKGKSLLIQMMSVKTKKR